MKLYEWGEKYSSGYAPIDNQHKVLLGILNKLLYFQLKDKKVILLLLKELSFFGQFHFNSEENMMILNRYENYESHKTSHHKLLEELSEKTELYKENKIELEEVVKMVVNWFVNHTAKTDKKLAKFLSEKTGEKGRLL